MTCKKTQDPVLVRLHDQADQARADFERCYSRFKRAFTRLEKVWQRLARLQRRIANWPGQNGAATP